MQWWRILVASVCLGLMSTPTWADHTKDAIALLEQMGQAARSLNYQGVFTYHAGQTMQSVQIYHRADAEGEIERLIALNGPAREVLRSKDTVTCINPDEGAMNVSRRPLGRGFPSDLLSRLGSAIDYYHLSLGGMSRIAGRDAQQVLILPVDSYRYGYRLWVDQSTHLLLKSELLDSQQQALETFTFTSLETHIDIPDAQLRLQTSGHEMTLTSSEPQSAADITRQNQLSRWEVEWLPEGFTLVAMQARLRAQNGAELEQRVYSDGLSSVSVFIERVAERDHHLNGHTRMGAIHAYGTEIHAHLVTVFGEVPAETVEKIGQSIQFAPFPTTTP